MNEASYEAAAVLIPKTYVNQGRDARRSHEKHIQTLIQQVKLSNNVFLYDGMCAWDVHTCVS